MKAFQSETSLVVRGLIFMTIFLHSCKQKASDSKQESAFLNGGNDKPSYVLLPLDNSISYSYNPNFDRQNGDQNFAIYTCNPDETKKLSIIAGPSDKEISDFLKQSKSGDASTQVSFYESLYKDVSAKCVTTKPKIIGSDLFLSALSGEFAVDELKVIQSANIQAAAQISNKSDSIQKLQTFLSELSKQDLADKEMLTKISVTSNELISLQNDVIALKLKLEAVKSPNANAVAQKEISGLPAVAEYRKRNAIQDPYDKNNSFDALDTRVISMNLSVTDMMIKLIADSSALHILSPQRTPILAAAVQKIVSIDIKPLAGDPIAMTEKYSHQSPDHLNGATDILSYGLSNQSSKVIPMRRG